MAFFCNDTQQIRIRISPEAEAILEDDMRSFRELKRSKLVNTILENYYEKAHASIFTQLERYESSIEDTFSKSSSNIKTSDFSILLKAHEEELKAEIDKYIKLKKNKPWNSIRLRNEFFTYLTDEKHGSRENKYYDSLSQYLSTIIEEYCRLPYIKREKIFYKSTFDDLEKAIIDKKQILITKKDTFYVLPYAIMSNPLSTYSYLVGYSYRESDSKDKMQPCSYRISNLTKDEYRIIKSKSFSLSKERKNYLHQQIAEKGVQFLSSELIDIVVKFTPEGIDNFYRQINLRPTATEPIELSNHPYTFRCSIIQAKYYFTQFGKNAEIISPADLREEFRDKYRDAYDVYTNPVV